MRCPFQDGDLELRVVKNSAGIDIAYSHCPSCGGHWLKAFDANYIEASYVARSDTRVAPPKNQIPVCPVCKKMLLRVTDAVIPPNTAAFRCSDDHGYFFTAGEFAKFKTAQAAKLNYFKLWQIPFSTVGTALLTTLVGLILAAGLIAGVFEGQKQQSLFSLAKETVSDQKIYVDPGNHAVTFVLATSQDTAVYLYIPKYNYYINQMYSADKKSHLMRVTGIPSGTFDYFFSFAVLGKTVKTETRSFTML